MLVGVGLLMNDLNLVDDEDDNRVGRYGSLPIVQRPIPADDNTSISLTPSYTVPYT